MKIISREEIKRLALETGFSLKPQPSGALDLNPYVYDFADRLIQKKNTEIEALRIATMDAIDHATHQGVETGLSLKADRIAKLTGSHVTMTRSSDTGELIAITLSDNEHRVVSVLWRKPR